MRQTTDEENINKSQAYAQLYAGFATIFLRHDFELFETDRSDVDFDIDMVVAHPRRDSKGVRVIVKS